MKGKIFICGALIMSCVLAGVSDLQAQKRMRDYGIKTGIFKTGEYNGVKIENSNNYCYCL